MLYFQVAYHSPAYGKPEPIGVPAPSARPINKNWDYHADIVASWHKKGNTLQI